MIINIKNIFMHLSIRNKISFSFITAFLVLLVALTTLASTLSSNIVIKKTTKNTYQNLDLISDKFDLIFDNLDSYSKIAITNTNIQKMLQSVKSKNTLLSYDDSMKVQTSLENLIEPKTMINGIEIFDLHGHSYGTSNITVTKEESYINELALSRDNYRVVNTHINHYESPNSNMNTNIISFVRKIYSLDDGSKLGIQEMTLNENFISSLYSNIKLGNSGLFFVLDKAGNIISHIDKKLLYKSVKDQPYYNALLKGDSGNEVRIGKVSYLVVSKKYTRLDWVIVGLVPINELLTDNRSLTYNIVLVGATCALVAVFISILLALSITNPIMKLKRVVKYAGKGDLTVYAEVVYKDEIGDLADEFNKMILKTKLLMESIYNEQKKKREYELLALQSQINPHFLYNTLESICGLAYLVKTDDLVGIVKDLAMFYRGVLSKGENIIELEDEVEITKRYLKILKVRYGDKFEYEFDIDSEVYKCFVIKLLLQPLVENAVYHGIKNKRGKGHVSIKGYLEKGRLCLVVRDDGIGMTQKEMANIFLDSDQDYKRKSFGVKGTEDRIKLYFGNEFGLEVQSIYGEGTVVKLDLPIIFNKDILSN